MAKSLETIKGKREIKVIETVSLPDLEFDPESGTVIQTDNGREYLVRRDTTLMRKWGAAAIVRTLYNVAGSDYPVFTVEKRETARRGTARYGRWDRIITKAGL